MGARAFMSPRLLQVLPDHLHFGYIGRPERAASGEGYPIAHATEQRRIIELALDTSAALVAVPAQGSRRALSGAAGSTRAPAGPGVRRERDSRPGGDRRDRAADQQHPAGDDRDDPRGSQLCGADRPGRTHRRTVEVSEAGTSASASAGPISLRATSRMAPQRTRQPPT